jgi:hypothetical protein
MIILGFSIVFIVFAALTSDLAFYAMIAAGLAICCVSH